jgi:rod shape-determining protein MreC
MAFKGGNFKTLIILIVIIVICLIVITISFKQSEVFDNMRSGSMDFFRPVQEKVYRFFNPAVVFFSNIKNYINLSGKITDLEKENADLLSSYTEDINIKIENDALRKLIGLDLRKDVVTVPAKVIGYYDSKWQSEIMLNLGRGDGVIEGMAVVDDKGLVGIVVLSSNSSSQVRLLTDPQSSVGARILSSRDLGVIEGSLDKIVYLNYIKADEEVFKGDIVITSELSDYLPAEVLIGRISKVSSNPANPYKEIVVDPFANFRKLEYVLVIKGMK